MSWIKYNRKIEDFQKVLINTVKKLTLNQKEIFFKFLMGFSQEQLNNLDNKK